MPVSTLKMPLRFFLPYINPGGTPQWSVQLCLSGLFPCAFSCPCLCVLASRHSRHVACDLVLSAGLGSEGLTSAGLEHG